MQRVRLAEGCRTSVPQPQLPDQAHVSAPCSTCRSGDILVTPQGGCPSCKGIEEKRFEVRSDQAENTQPAR